MDYLFKVLIIGDSNVGKSSLLVRFADNSFYTEYISTIGVDYRIKTLKVPHEGSTVSVKLQCWDTAGQEKFDNIVQSYYRGSHGIMLVFDVTNRESFDSLQKWLTKAETCAGNEVVKLLIGAKTDLEGRQVSADEAKNYASSVGLKYVETSAKESLNVTESFEQLAKDMLSKTGPGQQRINAGPNIIKPVEKKSKGCC
ncbi:Rab1a [Hexamita inflata]|uniref:Rab1a n=1 Tax=Hexamita inflata TaxID=28002 RepID=A0AA86QJT9_9EUKA|nr:Rab1a [Hexamita inflata]